VTVELRGGRVLLRAFRPDEHERAWAERQRSTTTIGSPGPDARERFLQRLEASGDWADGRLDLAVEADGELVGEIDVRAPQQSMPPGVCEFGIELWEECRGRGLGTEVVEVLTGWLHEQGYPRVQAGTNVTNGPMRRVLEKAGYAHEGDMRSFAPDGDGRADYALYAHVL
jgi:RimJ/RimL family protein N-acetyltransferase